MSDRTHAAGRRAALVRWTVCGSLVLAAHALALTAFRPDVEEADEDTGGPAAFVELAPEAAAPPAPSSDLAPGPQQFDSQASESEQQPPPPPVPQANPAPQPAAPEPPPTVQAPPSETAEEPVAPPSPTPIETPAPQPVASPSPESVETPPPPQPAVAEPDPPSDVSVPSAPPSAPAIAPQAVGPEPGEVKPAISPRALRWQLGLVAQIERFKRYPARGGGRFGVARVAFTIDRQGRLLDVRIVDGSGSAILDEEAIATVRRAAPFPAPPDVVSADQLSFVVPIRYAPSHS